jgi:DNA processing protein
MEGEMKEEDAISISIVGTRNVSWYGKEVATRLSQGLAKRGVTVVSGMARGIDSLAHRAALEAGGRTIAVLGNGLNTVYPPENRKLKEEIVERGAVISEFVMEARPERVNFPVRNRIISGLSLGTIVVEASSRSGALITARMALEQGREVFAVPGSVSSETSRGTNSLIKRGAKLVENVDDILEELPGDLEGLLKEGAEESELPPPQLSPEEEKVFSLLNREAQHIDILTEKSGLPASRVAGILVNLELEGLAEQLPGKSFTRSR